MRSTQFAASLRLVLRSRQKVDLADMPAASHAQRNPSVARAPVTPRLSVTVATPFFVVARCVTPRSFVHPPATTLFFRFALLMSRHFYRAACR